MRINKYIARACAISRREADEHIAKGVVKVNGEVANYSTQVEDGDRVELRDRVLSLPNKVIIMINKPVGYVCSRRQQDDRQTIYALLPNEYQNLKVAGRLDADSHGLVILSNDGDFIQNLSHPSSHTEKHYIVETNRRLSDVELTKIESGVDINDNRPSVMKISNLSYNRYKIVLKEGRNRQIRRTIAAIGAEVNDLQRTTIGKFELSNLATGHWQVVEDGSKQR